MCESIKNIWSKENILALTEVLSGKVVSLTSPAEVIMTPWRSFMENTINAFWSFFLSSFATLWAPFPTSNEASRPHPDVGPWSPRRISVSHPIFQLIELPCDRPLLPWLAIDTFVRSGVTKKCAAFRNALHEPVIVFPLSQGRYSATQPAGGQLLARYTRHLSDFSFKWKP
jgi:hypothetical protein